MGNIAEWLGGMLVPVMVILGLVALMSVVPALARRYKKVPPNAVGVFFGRKYQMRLPDGRVQTMGFRIISGGGKILLPFVEEYFEMDTSLFQVELSLREVPNRDNVRISVEGVATCKISTREEDLINAARGFLKKSKEEIKQIVYNIMEGHFRSIIGKMTVDEILREREKFNQQVKEESAMELQKVGIEVTMLVIQQIVDSQGYIEALGKTKTAQVKRDARIGQATADRDAEIGEAEAKREATIKATNAVREAETVRADNEAKIAEASMDRDVRKAKAQALIEAEAARARQAGPLSDAVALRDVEVAKVKVEEARIEAQTAVQDKERARKQKELEATVVVGAEAQKKKVIIEAEARQQSEITLAQGEKQAMVIRAEADKQSKELMGEGEAARIRAIALAQAQGDAAKVESMGRAEGLAIKAKLEAEADGLLKKAEALRQMEQAAQLVLVLEKAPMIIDALGKALGEAGGAIFSSIAAPMGNIDRLSIVDMGGGNGHSEAQATGLGKFANTAPEIVFNLIQKSQALGIDWGAIIDELGLKSAVQAALSQSPPPKEPGS